MSESLIGATLGKYEIVEMLGRGGMATVYKATQQAPISRVVAVKVLPRALTHDEAFMRRFRREAGVIAQLEHLHILPIYDYGEYDGMPYIVMRCLDGGTVQDRIHEGPLPWNDVVRIISEVAQALDYAHGHNIIHRDVKPSNILLDREGNAYLADFGVAKMTEGTSHLTGNGMVGTPAYMAPEQSDPAPVTPAVDIYALGVTLFEMITGCVPYQADAPIPQILMHIQKPVPSLLDCDPDIPPEVNAVVQEAMAKRPEQRYASAGAMARALEEAAQAAGGWHCSPGTLAVLPQQTEPVDEGQSRGRSRLLVRLGIGMAALIVFIGAMIVPVALGKPGGLLSALIAATKTPTPTVTAQPTPAPPSDTPAPTSSPLPTLTETPSPVPEPTETATPSPTMTPTVTPTPPILFDMLPPLLYVRNGPSYAYDVVASIVREASTMALGRNPAGTWALIQGVTEGTVGWVPGHLVRGVDLMTLPEVAADGPPPDPTDTPRILNIVYNSDLRPGSRLNVQITYQDTDDNLYSAQLDVLEGNYLEKSFSIRNLVIVDYQFNFYILRVCNQPEQITIEVTLTDASSHTSDPVLMLIDCDYD